MIACISPSYLWIEETLNTLKYAERARKIVKRVGKERREGEMGVGEYKEMVEELKREILGLKEELKRKEGEEKIKVNLFIEVYFYFMKALTIIMINDSVKKTFKIFKRPEFIHHYEGEGEEEKVFEEIGLKIYHNLEENYEIKQTLSELTNLRNENEISLRNYLTQLAEILDLPDSIGEKEKLTEEIKSINKYFLNIFTIFILFENMCVFFLFFPN
jgi:hypothetical protein